MQGAGKSDLEQVEAVVSCLTQAPQGFFGVFPRHGPLTSSCQASMM